MPLASSAEPAAVAATGTAAAAADVFVATEVPMAAGIVGTHWAPELEPGPEPELEPEPELGPGPEPALGPAVEGGGAVTVPAAAVAAAAALKAVFAEPVEPAVAVVESRNRK